MIHFILNNQTIATSMPPGMLLLDFIREHRQLKGTKIGCREGDCGACMVLAGTMQNGMLQYRSFTSCLTPLGNVHGKHVVTVEGLNTTALNPVQQAMCDESATQCGFCTPGFVVSLAGYCLSSQEVSQPGAIAAVDGNICRCTGYKSIERAAARIVRLLEQKGNSDPVAFACSNNLVPAWFGSIPDRLLKLPVQEETEQPKGAIRFVGGGTDLYVQQPAQLKHAPARFLYDQPGMSSIRMEGGRCSIGPSATVTDLAASALMQAAFPALEKYFRLVSSTPIRNMATISGNFINASPIGDLTIFFLALDATLLLNSAGTRRELPLRLLYKGYKTLDRQPGEYIERIYFNMPGSHSLFNFEKVSKRTNLDIASVNTAISLTMEGDVITGAHLSAGGVGPVPAYLAATALFLAGRQVDELLVHQATAIAQSEITPISDARGTARYKRLLLNQLIKAHFVTLFPQLQVDRLLQDQNESRL